MKRNVRLLYCILGSAVLALLNSSLLDFAKIGLFMNGPVENAVGVELFVQTINIISFAGFILLILFSIMLIINNLFFNEN